MTLEEARKELEKFVRLKTTQRPVFLDVILEATEPKRGHWELYDSQSGYAYNWRCSACKKYHFHNGEMLEKYKYCPNCGAKMFDKDIDVPDKNVGKLDEVEE